MQHPGTICPNRCRFEFAASSAFFFTTCLCTHRHAALFLTCCIHYVCCGQSCQLFRQRSGGTTALPVTGLGLAGSHKAPEAGSCISSVPLRQPGRALTASSQQHRSGFVNPKNTCERLQAKRVRGGSSAKVLCHRGRGNDASHHQARRDGVSSQQCTWVGAGAGCLRGRSAEVGSALLAAEQEQTGSMGAKSGSTGWHGVG